MADIYRESTGNLTYLGEGTESTEHALQILVTILDEMNENIGDLEPGKYDFVEHWRGKLGRAQAGVFGSLDFETLADSVYCLRWFR